MVEANAPRKIFEVRKWNAVALWAWGKFFTSKLLNISAVNQTKEASLISCFYSFRDQRGLVCDLQGAYLRAVHRLPGEPGRRQQWRVHGGVGHVQPPVPLPLHFKVAQDQVRLPPRQQRMGIPEVRQTLILQWPLQDRAFIVAEKRNWQRIIDFK